MFAFVLEHGNDTRHEIGVNFRDATGDVPEGLCDV